jgi:hypothetical protein
MSMISLYTDYLKHNNIKYDIIYVDKYNEVEHIEADNIFRYPVFIKKRWGKIRKIFAYFGFRKYGLRILSKEKYDFIVVWKTETALMFSSFLTKNAKKRYSINIRDYFMEKNYLILKRIEKTIENSRFSTISSEGFKSFLPNYNYITVHSFNKTLLEKCTPKKSLKKYGEPLHICFIGYVRFFDIDKKLILALGNDVRYIIEFFGEGSQHLEEFVLQNNIKNVDLRKGFPLEDTPDLLKNVDVINNLYGKDDIALDTAVSTKFYYALYLNTPILVFKGTYMEKISNEYGIGFSVGDDFSTLADDFYSWYYLQDFDKLAKQCKRGINDIKVTNEVFENNLKGILSDYFK